jgi:endoribonuclease Dicer
MLMLCNKNLFDTAKKLQLYQYVRSIAFSRRLWYPEGLKLLEGKGVNKNEEHQVIMHSLGDKSIADVCEAMIGAAFVSHDKPGEAWVEERWNAAVRAVTKLVHSKDHQISSWDGYRTKYVKPAYQTEPSTAAQRDLAQKVEIEHRYHFTYPRLLRAAFLHPSHPGMYEGVPNYERLEFLGDALLDMASITHLFYRYPDKDPQWLTEHKMAMVSNKFLGAVCVNTGFHKHLRYVSAILEPQIREYATELLEAKRTSGGARDYWTSVSDPPKCLPDIVESYIGAMFIDSDFNYGVVQDFFEKHIKWYFDDMSIYDTFANNHPCTHLYTLLQTGYGCQDYRLMAKEMPPVDSTELENKDIVAVVVVHNTIVSCSRGKSGRYARLRVAQQALEKMEGLTPIEFRAKFGCGCSLKREGVLASDGVVDQVVGADCGV